MRKMLNHLYAAGLVAAAFFLALIAIVILLQIGGRFIGIVIPSADEIAGYSMAASIFLALADTLRAHGHIRVEVIRSRTPKAVRRALDLWAHAFAACALAYFTFYSIIMTWNSFSMGETSPGLLGIPMWIPQVGMCVGLGLMVIACIEGTIDAWIGTDSGEVGVTAEFRSE